MMPLYRLVRDELLDPAVIGKIEQEKDADRRPQPDIPVPDYVPLEEPEKKDDGIKRGVLEIDIMGDEEEYNVYTIDIC